MELRLITVNKHVLRIQRLQMLRLKTAGFAGNVPASKDFHEARLCFCCSREAVSEPGWGNDESSCIASSGGDGPSQTKKKWQNGRWMLSKHVWRVGCCAFVGVVIRSICLQRQKTCPWVCHGSGHGSTFFATFLAFFLHHHTSQAPCRELKHVSFAPLPFPPVSFACAVPCQGHAVYDKQSTRNVSSGATCKKNSELVRNSVRILGGRKLRRPPAPELERTVGVANIDPKQMARTRNNISCKMSVPVATADMCAKVLAPANLQLQLFL